MSRGWLTLLCAVLVVWKPLTFAIEAAAALPTLSMRGPAGAVELFFHAAVAALNVAAAWALWQGSPAGPLLAKAAVALAAASGVQSLYWSVLPSNVFPSDRWPLAALTVAHAGAWLTYLQRSRRIRAMS